MAEAVSRPILQMIRRFVEDESVRHLSDQLLLQQFSDHRKRAAGATKSQAQARPPADSEAAGATKSQAQARPPADSEAAFGTLLRRHGPMVLDVCRGVLSNEADAEDAFQATFLILASKAGSIRKADSVGSWLHGVAYRTALKARAQSATRQKNEARAPTRTSSEPDDLTWREAQQVLHEELTRLAERYRVPLVACYLEGKTQEEAAAQLQLARSTLKERLERGRSLLRARLVKRGLGPAALLLATAWPAAASTNLPAALAFATIKAASLTAAAAATCCALHDMVPSVISAKVAALIEGVLQSMFLAKVKATVLLAASLAVLAIGLGGLALAGIGWAEPTAPAAEEKKPAEPAAARTLRLPETPYRYADIDLPAHFQTPVARRFDNTPADNPVTDHGATLGRALFYDTRLSANNTVSCGSCHVQKNAFVDPNRASKGFEGKRTDRHASSLVNLRYVTRGRFFWDERAGNLEETVLVPIQSKLEMGQDLTRLMEVLARDEHYPGLFQKAFGDEKITQERTAKALTQFLRSMVSCRSKYDEGRARVSSARDDFENYTVQENRGKALFMSNCAVCHLPGQDAHFVMIAPANNGLDADHKTGDGGVGDITLNGRQIGLFKSPSLRNVEVAAPYMHDGRFDTLEKVLDHYSKEVKPHPNLDPRMHRLNFTGSEKAALIAFLKTLTDHKFLTDPKFSDPFQ
jgi:cytochrome c peroxidase